MKEKHTRAPSPCLQWGQGAGEPGAPGQPPARRDGFHPQQLQTEMENCLCQPAERACKHPPQILFFPCSQKNVNFFKQNPNFSSKAKKIEENRKQPKLLICGIAQQSSNSTAAQPWGRHGDLLLLSAFSWDASPFSPPGEDAASSCPAGAPWGWGGSAGSSPQLGQGPGPCGVPAPRRGMKEGLGGWRATARPPGAAASACVCERLLAVRHAPLRLFTAVYQGLRAAIKFMKIKGVSSRLRRERARPFLSHTD